MADKKDLNISCMFLLGLMLFLVFFPIAILLIVATKLGESPELEKEYKKAKSKAKKIEKAVESKIDPVLENLSERQKKIMDEITAKGQLEMTHLSSKFKNVTARTLRRDLSKLVSMGHITKSGSTRNSVYSSKKS